jgi:hypothetical protein
MGCLGILGGRSNSARLLKAELALQTQDQLRTDHKSARAGTTDLLNLSYN